MHYIRRTSYETNYPILPYDYESVVGIVAHDDEETEEDDPINNDNDDQKINNSKAIPPHQMGYYIRSRVCSICHHVIADPYNWADQFTLYQDELDAIENDVKVDPENESDFLFCYRCHAMICRQHVDNIGYEDLYYNIAKTRRFRCEYCLFHNEYYKYQFNECQIIHVPLQDKLKYV